MNRAIPVIGIQVPCVELGALKSTQVTLSSWFLDILKLLAGLGDVAANNTLRETGRAATALCPRPGLLAARCQTMNTMMKTTLEETVTQTMKNKALQTKVKELEKSS